MKKNVFAMLISIALTFAVPVSVPAAAIDPAAASTAAAAVNTPSPEPSPDAATEPPSDTTATPSAETTAAPSPEPSPAATAQSSEPPADAAAVPSPEPQSADTAAPSPEASPDAAIMPISEPEETQAEEAAETREWDEILAELPPEAIHMDGITTFVRLRDLSGILGFELDWDDDAKAVTLMTDNVSCRITIGQTEFTCNQTTEQLEHPPFIQGERTFIEEDFILWLFGE